MCPITASLVIVTAGLLIAQMCLMGFGQFFMVMGLGILFALGVLAIGFGLYKAICYFQEGCRLQRW
jgi:hypothetical protein